MTDGVGRAGAGGAWPEVRINQETTSTLGVTILCLIMALRTGHSLTSALART